MKYIIQILFTLIIPLLSIGQIVKTDTADKEAIIVGVVTSSTFAGKTISSSLCWPALDVYLEENTPVLIGGITNCEKNSYPISAPVEIIIIYYNNEMLYIKKEDLQVQEGVFAKFREMNTERAEAFRLRVAAVSEKLYKLNKTKAKSFLAAAKSKGLVILNWEYYDESKYTSGTSVKIRIYNPTSKTIKYVWFTFAGYNAVGDRVIDSRRGATIVRKGIGPLKPGEEGSYVYEYVWFSDLVETAKIISAKVQYMDGTIKQINSPKDIIMPKSLFKVIEMGYEE